MIRPRHIMMSLKRAQQQKVVDKQTEENSRTGGLVLKVIVGGISFLTLVNVLYLNSVNKESDYDVRRKNAYNKEKAIEEGKAFMKIYEEQQAANSQNN